MVAGSFEGRTHRYRGYTWALLHGVPMGTCYRLLCRRLDDDHLSKGETTHQQHRYLERITAEVKVYYGQDI